MPSLSPEDLPDRDIEPWSPALQADSLPLEPQEGQKNISTKKKKILDIFCDIFIPSVDKNVKHRWL